MKFFKNRFALFSAVVIIATLITGGILYSQNSANTADSETPAVQTAKVRKSDMVITASAAGVVEPSAQSILLSAWRVCCTN